MVEYSKNDLSRFNGRILSPNIILIRPQVSKLLTSNVLLFDDQIKLVVDTGGFQYGSGQMSMVKDFFKIESDDIVLFSHYHIDHVFSAHIFSESHKLIHELETDVLRSLDNFLEFCLGDKKGVLEHASVWKPRFLSFLEHESLSEWNDLSLDNIQPLDTNRSLELGEKTPEIIHLPGHSPGHCGLYEPVSQILFIGDIEIGSRFGPWYGWANANLQTFRKTIVKLKDFIEKNEVSWIIPSHSAPIEDKQECLKRLADFNDIFNLRKRTILEFITKQHNGITIGEITNQSFIYQGRNNVPWEIFERIMVEKHIEELLMEGYIICEGDRVTSR
ncbi:MAG: MBL fold metallo-hydrolase [Candidatus Hodarchaeales archaeon]|jgi:glyoxylase-like metal-dependent hydrolase (beta-lactamase superfamily II)